VVIEVLVANWLECSLDVSKVDDHACLIVNLAGYMNRDAVGVTVQPGALVVGSHMRQAMSGLEGEFLEELHL
jgi:hypothetical protein